jgi:uncharacterized membrane protein
MADDAPQDVLVAISFPDQYRANEFLTAAARLVSQHKLVAKDAVFVTKDADGKTHVRETHDLQTGPAAASAGLWSAFIGALLAGPVGLVVAGAIGAGAGALAAKIVDLGIPDEWVDWLKQTAEPGHTVLAILVHDVDRDALVAELERFHGARLLYGNLPPAVLDRFREALGEQTATAESPTADAAATANAPTEPPPSSPPV